jgi:valyl-tRNA synthetase
MNLPKTYDHTTVEKRIYEKWMESGYFNPDKLPHAQNRKPYTIIMPPPNANAPLHIGHALFVTIEDILIRFARMTGRRALWLPGTDHAGFETQVVFEKKLEKEGRSRFKMPREEFYKEIYEFVQSNKHITEEGLKRLGASCDWSRNIFTLDPRIIKIVYETFEKMYKDGLIYRGQRIGNWCVKHQTTLSNLETKYEERQEPFYYLKYGPFIIGTSRPETKFGDKYVVMHPKDKRYEQYHHGQKIQLEWINGPITATILKDEAVDKDFGTGVMTITPWHDPIDFELSERLRLDREQIIDFQGRLLPIAGEFAGMKILEARPKIIEKLTKKGLVERVDETYKHNVQLCYKCGNLIEPQIIPQWFVAMTKPLPDGRISLRDMAVYAVKNKIVRFIPSHYEKLFMRWMENLHDWPISRQIAWGIPIPVKYCKVCGETIVDITDNIQQCPQCQSKQIIKDPDTFDTWFSSGQWPYATLLAHGEKDFNTYFPTQVLETGWDILFFWVARMIMLSYYRTGQQPFSDVLLHGLVRDKDRQKISKSKGNVIDPLGVIDLYGCDALRFALIFSTAAGNDIPLAEDKIRGMKHFGNKLWNITRFVLSNVEQSNVEQTDWQFQPITEADKTISDKLKTLKKVMTDHLENYRLHEAAQAIYQFTWHEFADIYLETTKIQMQDQQLAANTKKLLLSILTDIIKLLHPFMPFITEEIWGKLHEAKLLPSGHNALLMVENWPA